MWSCSNILSISCVFIFALVTFLWHSLQAWFQEKPSSSHFINRHTPAHLLFFSILPSLCPLQITILIQIIFWLCLQAARLRRDRLESCEFNFQFYWYFVTRALISAPPISNTQNDILYHYISNRSLPKNFLSCLSTFTSVSPVMGLIEGLERVLLNPILLMTVSSLLFCKILGAWYICKIPRGCMLPLLSSISSSYI